MTNVFDRADGVFVVLRNDEEQHSLWPRQFAVPEGWLLVYGPAKRDACTAWIAENWTDLRPAGLRAALSTEQQ